MNIPPKYEDVVAQLEAALGREAALREELGESVCELADALSVSFEFKESLKAICQPIIEDSRRTLIIENSLDILAGHIGENGDEGYSTVMGAIHEIGRLVKFNSELQQRLTVAEQRATLLTKALGDIIECSDDAGAKDCAAEAIAAANDPACKCPLTTDRHLYEKCQSCGQNNKVSALKPAEEVKS